MARISGILLPDNKTIRISLTYIYGIGQSTSDKLLNSLNIDGETKTKDLDETQLSLLREEIEKRYQVEGNLRRIVGLNIKRLKEINCYRGMRHKAGLPSRGQNTKTNARTRRGKRQSAGSGKIKLEKK